MASQQETTAELKARQDQLREELRASAQRVAELQQERERSQKAASAPDIPRAQVQTNWIFINCAFKN